MQSYAHDDTLTLIFAPYAKKHHNYQCIECAQPVRLRKGLHRQAHYYHTQPNQACRQHAKGMPHLMLQDHLKTILPEGEVELECPFPTINRIADVAWHSQRLIYEIQCSPISKEEIQLRNQNYASVGYQVIWIFHDHRYNQYRLSAAEQFMQDYPHYFSNMNADGEGKIYDQLSLIVNGKRMKRLPPLTIDLSLPQLLDVHLRRQSKLPFILHRRQKNWSLSFAGDILDCVLMEPHRLTPEQQDLCLQLDQWSQTNKRFTLRQFWETCLVRPYQALLKSLLESACR
jgi:competence protein CoiA